MTSLLLGTELTKKLNLIILRSLTESIVVAVNPTLRRGEAAAIQPGICLKDHEPRWLANGSLGGTQHCNTVPALVCTGALLFLEIGG